MCNTNPTDRFTGWMVMLSRGVDPAPVATRQACCLRMACRLVSMLPIPLLAVPGT